MAQAAKVVILGRMRVGKTSLRKRFMGRGFRASHLPTMGADFAVKDIQLDGNLLKLQIWDIAGQDSFQMVRKRFYRNTAGAIVVFDITDKISFSVIPDWLKEMWSVIKTYAIPLVIVGNKNDLEEERAVLTEDAQRYVSKLQSQGRLKHTFIDYIETSAKTGENVEKAFHKLGKKILTYLEQKDYET